MNEEITTAKEIPMTAETITNIATSLAEVNDRSELYKALAAAQGEIQAAEANQENPHFQFRYADLSACMAVIREPRKNEGP